jgi:hypothetical protein
VDDARHSSRRRQALLLVGVVVLYVTSAWLKSRLYENHASALIGFGCAAPKGCFAEFNRASLPHSAVVFRSGGYDGQFFYYLGRELYGGPHAVVDSEAFRRARIGLPLLAGPLLALGDAGRVYGLPFTLLAVHLLSVWQLARAGTEPLRVALFAFNPFSLLSFMLCTADGAALSLAVLGALALAVRGRARAFGLGLIAFALLTKETLVAVPLALAAGALLDGASGIGVRLVRALLLTLTVVPLLVWWHVVGFSFGLAASHGGLPFSGFFRYLPHVDLARSLLACLLVLGAALGSLCLRARGSRVAGFVLLASVALVSTATAEEYWAIIANVARLFTPMAAAPALLGDPSALTGSLRPGGGGWTRRIGLLWALVLFSLSALFVVREATRRPLPHYVIAS